MSVCILPPVSTFSIFFFFFFTAAHPLEIANPRTRIRGRKLLDDAEVTRPKSHIRARTSVSNDTIPSDSPTRFLLTLFLGVCLKSRYRRLPLSAGFDPWLIKAQLMLARNDEDSYKAFLPFFLSLSVYLSLSHLISMRGNQSHLKIPEISAAEWSSSSWLFSTGNVAASRIFRTRLRLDAGVAGEENPAIYAVLRWRSVASVGGHWGKLSRWSKLVVATIYPRHLDIAAATAILSSDPRRRNTIVTIPNRESEERLRGSALPLCGCVINICARARALASSQEYRIACRTRGGSSYGITWFRESHYRQIDCGYKILEVEMESI